MPTLRQLQYLVAVADLLNFSRAAERLNVTQPTLSAQIAQLEARLGVVLFERSRTRVLLTPEGAGIAQRARAVLRATEELRDYARTGAADPLGGLLKLGVAPTVGAYLLSVAMPQLRAELPALRLYLREESPEALQRHLAEGQYDAIVLPRAPGTEEFDSLHLLTEELQLVLPAGHPLAACDQVPPAALKGETMLTMAPGEEISEQIASLCAATGAGLARDFEGTSLDTLRQMVATGMGVALLPALYIRSEVMRETLVVTRPLSSGAPRRRVTLAWRKGHPVPARFRALARVITSAVAEFNRAG